MTLTSYSGYIILRPQMTTDYAGWLAGWLAG